MNKKERRTMLLTVSISVVGIILGFTGGYHIGWNKRQDYDINIGYQNTISDYLKTHSLR